MTTSSTRIAGALATLLYHEIPLLDELYRLYDEQLDWSLGGKDFDFEAFTKVVNALYDGVTDHHERLDALEAEPLFIIRWAWRETRGADLGEG